jgi:C_GCAxxG_C_C family probable redox protein
MSKDRRSFLKTMTSCCLVASLAPLGVSAGEQEKTESVAEGITQENRAEKALAMMRKYGSCCTGVLASFASEVGMDEMLAARAGFGMAGGIGSLGHVCGAVSGAAMVIGLKTVDENSFQDMKASLKTIDIVKEFVTRFEEQHSSIQCRDLIGHDISTMENRQIAMKENAFVNCSTFVTSAVTILDEILSSENT